MYVLGISAFYHASSASLIKDGRVIAAAEEERFTRIKHDNAFPIRAISFCLEEAGIEASDLDHIAYYEKPLLKFERILDTFVGTYPYSLGPFVKTIPEWLGKKIKVEKLIRDELNLQGPTLRGKIFFIPHHLSHAAASYYPSPFSNSAILTMDGVGEYQTTALWRAKGNSIEPLLTINFPHSLGLLYSTFTAFLGFAVNDEEYKVMGMAAYGTPRFTDKIYKIIDIKDDGSFRLNMDYFSFRESFKMWNKRFEQLFGKSRLPNDEVLKRHIDIACSIQKVTEDIYFKILQHLYNLSREKNLCIGGGVGLNALANGKIFSKTLFQKIYIMGAAGDMGASLGAALFTYHAILGFKKREELHSLDLGSSYTNEEVEDTLKTYNLSYKKFRSEEELVEKSALLLSQNKVIGWFQGRMEFGPRALGNRSILANPKPRFMKDRVNKVKKREQFRPFAGSILQEKVHEYFEVPEKNHFSPFMIFCFQVKKEKRKDISSIVHKDGTCRIQTVYKGDGRYYALIKKFYELTGIPCILNTSFNLKGEPIVENPKQAIEDFRKSDMDRLVIEDFLIIKN